MATKSEQTRELLVETALRLFRERGYESTTMRLIAGEAGVSPANAYYYFEGKDALVQQLYLRIQADHRTATLERLTDGAPVAQNLRAMWGAGLEVMEPYHAFGATLLHSALASSAGTNPLSGASRQAREDAIGLVADVLARSKGVPGGALGRQLPLLLWLVYLGITVHWVTDESAGRRRTRVLVEGLAPILARALTLARLPVGRSLVGDITNLVERLTRDAPTPGRAGDAARRSTSGETHA